MRLTRTVDADRALSVILVLCFALLILALARPLLGGRLYIFDDLGSLHIPLRHVYQAALHAGDSVLWAPQLFAGLYLHGEGQVGMYHPLHVLLYWTLPLHWAFSLEFLLSYIAMFPGMYVFLRRVDLPRSAALFGAITFTFSGFNLLHFMHMNAIAIVAHIPWLLWAIDLLLRTTDTRRVALAQLFITLGTASELLLGYPQYVWFSIVTEGVFVAWRLRRATAGWRVARWLWATTLGVLLSAVQLLPTAYALAESERSAPTLEFRLSDSLHPANLMQLWSPYALAGRVKGGAVHEFGLYNGAVCSLALAWVFLRRRGVDRRRRLALAAGIFAAAMILVALGARGGVYLILANLPLVGLFRAPSRYIVLLHLGLAVLAGVMMAELLQLGRGRKVIRWGRLWPLGVPVAMSVVTVAAHAWTSMGPDRHQWLMHLSSLRLTGLGAGLMVAATALVVAAARGVRWAPGLIVVFTVVDLGMWGFSYIQWMPPQSMKEFVDSVAAPPAKVQADRIHVVGGQSPRLYQNVLAMKGYHLVDGYVALRPRRVLLPDDVRVQHLLGVRWVFRDGRWVELEDPLPRVRMVSETLVSRDVASDIGRIDSHRTAIVSEPVGNLGATAEGTARVAVDRPGLIEIETSTPSRQLLVLAESYHEGWTATEDGRPIAIHRAYGDLLGCVVNPGQRRIVFRFKPLSFDWGVRITQGTGVVALVSVVVSLLRGRAGRRPEPPLVEARSRR